MKEEGYWDRMGKLPEENREAMRKTQARYGDNKWWLSDNWAEMAYYQLSENMLLVDFGDFHKGVEELLGRPVWTHEFGLNIDVLRAEAEMALHGLTQEERDTNMKQGLKTLFDFAEKKHKPVIAIVTTEEH